eukprot:2008204-Pyramimonas_sp.AAC.1
MSAHSSTPSTRQATRTWASAMTMGQETNHRQSKTEGGTVYWRSSFGSNGDVIIALPQSRDAQHCRGLADGRSGHASAWKTAKRRTTISRTTTTDTPTSAYGATSA